MVPRTPTSRSWVTVPCRSVTLANLKPPKMLLGSLTTPRTSAPFIPKVTGPEKVNGCPYPTNWSPLHAVAVPTAATVKSP